MRLPIDFARLTLQIVRLQDAEILLDAEADTLLTQVRAAQTAREQGETNTQRQHLEQIAGFVEALVDARLLPGVQGYAVIETARQMAEEQSGEDTGDAPRLLPRL